MFSCKKNAQLISDKLERKLTMWERMSLAMHGMMCSTCRRLRVQMESLNTLFKHYYQSRPRSHQNASSKSADGLSPEAKARIRKQIVSQQQQND